MLKYLVMRYADREQMDMDKGAQQNELEAVEHEIVR